MRAGESHVSRDSAEYTEIIADVFVETVNKWARKAMYDEQDPEITPALMECLQYVYLHGASPVGEIASGLEITTSAASQLVDRLVKKGLATRRENESDRRLMSVELTPGGKEAVGRMRRRKSEWFEAILGAMPEGEQEAFRDGVEGFLRVALAGEDNIDRACVRCGMEHVSFCVVNRVKSARLSGEADR